MERIPIIEHQEGKPSTIAPHLRETNKGTYLQRHITRKELSLRENPREAFREWLEEKFGALPRWFDIKIAAGDAFNNALEHGAKDGEYRSAIRVLWQLKGNLLKIAIHSNVHERGGLTKEKILGIIANKQRIFQEQMGIIPKRKTTDKQAAAIGAERADRSLGGRGLSLFIKEHADKGSAVYLGKKGKTITTHLAFNTAKINLKPQKE